ncbi:hypothetical protein [Paenibacillus taichungensis]|uniref:hypothetical protein n=1 Tax=Paenibacillus taichungensis TaxID=484184 RepID=UPI003D9AA829
MHKTSPSILQAQHYIGTSCVSLCQVCGRFFLLLLYFPLIAYLAANLTDFWWKGIGLNVPTNVFSGYVKREILQVIIKPFYLGIAGVDLVCIFFLKLKQQVNNLRSLQVSLPPLL